MLSRIFILILGFGLMIVGFTYIILYLNLLTIGYNLSEYVNFIIRRFECYFSVIGFIIFLITLFIGGKYELYL